MIRSPARRPRWRTAAAAASTLVAFCAGAPGPASAGHPIEDFGAWASSVESLQRGFLDVAQPDLGSTAWGEEGDVLGPAEGDTTTVLSLGDGGTITLGFTEPIPNGPGDDFAVFENGFFETETGLLFAELAYVEVSSNGVDFALFANQTFNTMPLGTFGLIEAPDYVGFAGVDPAGEGTGFDLAELADDPLVGDGLLDLDAVRYVRVVDVIGDGSTVDDFANPIYDPYPTLFATGGFDLDGVGALHVPEPSTDALGVAALLMLFSLAWRRAAASAR